MHLPAAQPAPLRWISISFSQVYLPLANDAVRRNGKQCDNDRQQDIACICLALHIERERAIDHGVHDLRGNARAAVCGGDNDIEHFQAADQAVYERVIERRQDQRERNAPEALPCVCAVDGRGFLIFRRNGLKSGKDDDHVKAGPLPDLHAADRQKRQLCICQPVFRHKIQSERAEELVEQAVGMQNCRKDNANGNGTDDGREEADSAQIVAQVELPVQKYGQCKTKANLSDSRHNRKNDRIKQRPLDAGIADDIFVVHEPDKVRSGKVPVCKGIPDKR